MASAVVTALLPPVFSHALAAAVTARKQGPASWRYHAHTAVIQQP